MTPQFCTPLFCTLPVSCKNNNNVLDRKKYLQDCIKKDIFKLKLKSCILHEWPKSKLSKNLHFLQTAAIFTDVYLSIRKREKTLCGVGGVQCERGGSHRLFSVYYNCYKFWNHF